MPEFLFEIGCEELPAGSVQKATYELKEGIETRLKEAGLTFTSKDPLWTPRRMIVCVQNLPEVQPDQEKSQRGPAVAAAYDSEGKPTKALEGFCRGQGVHFDELIQEGGHVWVKKKIVGTKTIDLLADIVPAAVAATQFPKTMRWADGSFRFARPIRWMLASFNRKLVQFQIESIQSSLLSRGHRFRAPQPFEATTLEELVTRLRAAFVEPDFNERVNKIRDQVSRFVGADEPDPALVEENANLTEWPEALSGQFPAEFLDLPGPVLQTVMAKHERFFPVKDSQNAITNTFVSVRNGGQEAAVREGNAWVLKARFNDARFFFEEDRKHSLEDFLERTRKMTFQEKLGTIRQRADRLASLCREVAVWSAANEEEAGLAYEAGLYAKADLTTGLVSELDELQGVIGGEYAKREGFSESVCWAIASHYDLSKNSHAEGPEQRTAIRLLIADQLDKITGFMGLGHAPTGSSDPFGLRRAVTMLIEAAWIWPTPLSSYRELLLKALEGYAKQDLPVNAEKALTLAQEVFETRYRTLLDGRHDQIDAAVLPGEELLDPRAVRFRLEAVSLLAEDTTFVQSATRPANIVSAALKKGIDFTSARTDESSLASAEGVALWQAVQVQTPIAEQACRQEDPEKLKSALAPLVDPVNSFFDSTMVMVDDAEVRGARLKVLSECDKVFRLAGDWTKIVIEG